MSNRSGWVAADASARAEFMLGRRPIVLWESLVDYKFVQLVQEAPPETHLSPHEHCSRVRPYSFVRLQAARSGSCGMAGVTSC
jgi:hypothetical protein